MTKFPFTQYPTLVDQIVSGIYKQYPELEEKFGERGKIKCREDNEHHLNYLETAFLIGEEKIFTDYALWLNNVLVSRGMQTAHLIDNFERIQDAIQDFKEERFSNYKQYLTKALESLSSLKV